jgi:hypothetical protein
VTRKREIITVWVLLSAPVVAWVVLLDIALLSSRTPLDLLLHVVLLISIATIVALAIGIVDAAHENWRVICRYMAATFLCEAIILFLARNYVGGNQSLICSVIALVAALTILFGSAKH